ncbi:MAG: ammonia channel protein, partial [bacterium]|nr:ammonia channel protein [bacterium]
MKHIRKKLILLLIALAVAGGVTAFTPILNAQEKANPTLEQRVDDLEAYLNNTARGADAAGATVLSKVGSSGPGHNGWMMTSTALVLFMTLPGLAL